MSMAMGLGATPLRWMTPVMVAAVAGSTAGAAAAVGAGVCLQPARRSARARRVRERGMVVLLVRW
jgi:hypothetical protein